MKKFLFLLALICLIFGVIISVVPSGQEKQKLEAAPETAASSEETTQAPSEETVLPPPEGTLLLSVSEINFSLPGEQEKIYLGSVPEDRITWESGDETVATVENGVLTSVGPGTTTVTASCENQSVSCRVGCLARTEEELYQMDLSVLRSPRRLAPEIPVNVNCFYEDALMMGDSITYGFFTYEAMDGRLGSPQCLFRGSVGIHNLLTHILDYNYQGEETPVEDILYALDPNKVFILLGTNDVQVRSIDTVLDELDQLLNRILQKNPDLDIYLESVFPVVCLDPYDNGVNERIRLYNMALEGFCQEHGYHYVPVAPYLEDHIPAFSERNCQDNFHPSYDGVCVWIDALKTYAYSQMIKGE